jgi:hypothetical protein
MLISLHLPSILKMCEWKILFSIQTHGVAIQTFYEMVQEHENTVIVIQDDQDQIFGSFQ